jgi:hypothetical protein
MGSTAMIAIGGLGGSGTRVIAHSVRRMGFHLGSDLNASLDNLWFTLLFKRSKVLEESDDKFAKLFGIFADALQDKPVDEMHRDLLRSLCLEPRAKLTTEYLLQRVENLCHGARLPERPARVAWKEPNTHVVLDRLLRFEPQLKYVHVMRNGLDMAFSSNQTQARLWGPQLTGRPFEPSARYSLHYWRKAHERVFQIGRQMGESFCLINFDELCHSPSESVDNLAAFVGVTLSEELKETLCCEVRRPTSIGRFREHDQAALDREDIDFVAACGFPTT